MLNRYGIGVRIDGTDIGPLVIEGGTIDYGRQSVFEQPEPPQCTLTMFTRNSAPQYPGLWPEFGEGDWSTASGFTPTHDTDDEYIGGAVKAYIGAPVWVSATTDSGFTADHDTKDVYDGAEYRRFTGRIVALEYNTDRLTVTAVSEIEQWARVGMAVGPSSPIDSDPDTVRADDIAIRVGAPSTLHIDGPPGLEVAPLKPTDFPLCLGEYLTTLANDTDALYYADREGRVRFRSRGWTPPPVYTVPWSVTDHDVDMEMELGTVENEITLNYLQPNPPGSQDGVASSVTVSNVSSVNRYGKRSAMYDCQVWGSADATKHAQTILNAQRAAWNLPEVTVHMVLATDAQVAEICALDIGHHVLIPSLPLGAPVPDVDAQILGYTEYLSSQSWSIDLHLSPTVTPFGA